MFDLSGGAGTALSSFAAYQVPVNQLVCELAKRRCASRTVNREADLTGRRPLLDALGAGGGAYAIASRTGGASG